MKYIGIAASAGYAIQKVYKIDTISFEIKQVPIKSVALELQKLEKALKKARKDLTYLITKTKQLLGTSQSQIFEAHLQILDDIEIKNMTINLLNTEQICVESIYQDVTNHFARILETMDNPYMRERSADILDVQKRVLTYLLNKKPKDTYLIKDEVILVANDLTPSEMITLDKNFVKGIATNIGGKTSHSTIMARSLEIPAVVGLSNILDTVKDGDTLIVDGIDGIVILNPSIPEIDEYKQKKDLLENKNVSLQVFKNAPSITKDNHEFLISANISSISELNHAVDNGAEGIGLFRTEFLFMERDTAPSEEEQFNIYKQVLKTFPNQNVLIRTIDFGGDKNVKYLHFPEEKNPFLGYRSLRYCLQDKKLFIIQLRALLRTTIYGKLCILFPMIATLEELRLAKKILSEVEFDLVSKGVTVKPYQIGMMVEIPAVAVLADKFAKEVDFFSIGTNDLIQYMFSADRMNPNVAYLYQPYHPALHRLIKNVIEAAHIEHKWVGLCGEIASDPYASLLVVGLGIDELSMTSSSILEIKKNLSKSSYNDLTILANSIIQDEETNIGVLEKLQNYFETSISDSL